MSAPRASEITRLSALMLNSMQADIRDATASEVIGAVMSTALATLMTISDAGGNVEALRPVIEKMWSVLPKHKVDG